MHVQQVYEGAAGRALVLLRAQAAMAMGQHADAADAGADADAAARMSGLHEQLLAPGTLDEVLHACAPAVRGLTSLDLSGSKQASPRAQAPGHAWAGWNASMHASIAQCSTQHVGATTRLPS